MSAMIKARVAKVTTPIREYISPHWDKVSVQAQQRWQRLEAREQRVLQGLGVFLVVIIVWFAIWQPLQERTARAEARLAAEYSTQRYVEQQIARVLQARSASQSGAQAVTANQLSGLINTLSNNLDIEVTRMQPQNESLVLVFNEVEFNRLVEFLVRLAERQVMIEAVDVSETNEPGVVRVRRLQVRA
ncbi:MAG: type II secretion system protein M [Idiomarina sp.]|nr:type II secretion system protein M [Idiomarina sp.]